MKNRSYVIGCSKSISQENVELCLELEMDEGVEEILASPGKCRSALLDVTVIKPKELEAFGSVNTNTLKGDQVRKLIVSMAKQKREKQKYIDNLVKRSLKYDDTIIRVSKHDCDNKYDKIFANAFRGDAKRVVINAKEQQKSSISLNKNVKDLNELVNMTESVHPLFSKIRKSLKNVESEITNMQNINLVLNPNKSQMVNSQEFRIYKQQIAEEVIKNNYLTTQQIYKTANHFQDFKPFTEYHNKNDSSNKTCVCKNCGIVGFLDECQKRPMFMKSSNPPSEKTPNSTKINYATTDKHTNPLVGTINESFYQNFYLNNINERIKKLEERIALQEEKSVPRDYFKKIVTKIISYISPKLFNLRADDKKIISEAASLLSKYKETMAKAAETSNKKTKDGYSDLNANLPLELKHLYEHKINKTIKTHLTKTPESSSRAKSHKQSPDNAWKWGEEVLKPGIDLKTKIMSLLDEQLHTVPAKPTYKNYEHKYTTCCYSQEKYDNRAFAKAVKDNIKNEILRQTKATGEDKSMPTYKSQGCSCGNVESSKNINVAYVNPKLDVWRKDSQSATNNDSANSDRSDGRTTVIEKLSTPKMKDLGKQEFINILSKTKDSDKELLWKNIWTQAQASGQTKEDTITIKIPNQEPNGTVLETELVIKEIEELLTKKLNNKDHKKTKKKSNKN